MREEEDAARRLLGLSKETYDSLVGDPIYLDPRIPALCKSDVLVLYRNHVLKQSIAQDKQNKKNYEASKRKR